MSYTCSMAADHGSALEIRYLADNGFRSASEMEREHSPILLAVFRQLTSLRTQKPGRELTFIDLGCGNGALLRSIAREFPDVYYFGIDIDVEKIQRGRSLFPMPNVSLGQGNLCKPSEEWFPAVTFDIVLVNAAFLVLPGVREKLWSWLARRTELVYGYAYAEDDERNWAAIKSCRNVGVRLDAIEPVVDGGTAIWVATYTPHQT